MMISTKGRYALRLLVDIGEHQGTGCVPLKESAKRQDISEKYLEIIVKLLVREGLLVGTRGKEGGYRLSRLPEEYRVRKILEVADGPLAPVICVESGQSCARAPECRTRPLWEGLNLVITQYLDRFTLADLMEKRAETSEE